MANSSGRFRHLLRTALNNTVKSPSSSFVSTDDALTALIWKAISRERLSSQDFHKVVVGQSCGVRKAMGVIRMYLDMM